MKRFWPVGIILLIFYSILATVACGDDDDDVASSNDSDDATDDDASNDDDSANDDNDDDSADDDDADDDDSPNDDIDDDIADDDVDDDATDDDDASGDIWTDLISGLVWQDGDSGGFNWEQALSYCENLSWGGYNDWRLPTLSELRSLIRDCDDTATGGACGVTDECLAYMSCWNPPCQGCSYWGGLGIGGRYWPSELSGDGWIYWSSSVVEENSFTAWRIHFYNGLVSYNDKDYFYWARCVR